MKIIILKGAGDLVSVERQRKRKHSWASGSSESTTSCPAQETVTRGQGHNKKRRSSGAGGGLKKKKDWNAPRPPRQGIALSLRSNPEAVVVPGLPYYCSW